MTHGNDIGVIAYDFYRIGNGFALRGGAACGRRKPDHRAAKLQHRSLKAEPCACARLEKQSGKLLPFADVLILIGILDDVLGDSDEAADFFYRKIRDIQNVLHITASL